MCRPNEKLNEQMSWFDLLHQQSSTSAENLAKSGIRTPEGQFLIISVCPPTTNMIAIFF